MEKNKKRNKITIIFTIVEVLIIILGICFFAYKIVSLKENQKDNNIPEEVEKDKKLVLKLKETGFNCTTSENCKEFEIETETTNAKYITTDDMINRFVLYNDNNLKIYDLYTKEIYNLGMKQQGDQYSYSILINSDLTKPTGLVSKEKDITKFYDIETKNEMIIESNPSNFSVYKLYDGKYLVKTGITTQEEDYKIIINTKTEEALVNRKEFLGDKICGEVSGEVIKSNDNYYFYLACTSASAPYYEKIYSEDGKLIIDMNSEYPEKTSYNLYSSFDGYLYVGNKNSILKFDNKGNLLETNNSYNNIIALVSNYVFFVDSENMLEISNLNTKETKKLLDYSEYSGIGYSRFGYKGHNYYQTKKYINFQEIEPGIYFSLLKGINGGVQEDYYYNPDTFMLKFLGTR